MRSKHRDPDSPEAVAAVLDRISSMSPEEWDHWVIRLATPPNGVEATWRNHKDRRCSGSRQGVKVKAAARKQSGCNSAKG
jgi:hypothetical protein